MKRLPAIGYTFAAVALMAIVVACRPPPDANPTPAPTLAPVPTLTPFAPTPTLTANEVLARANESMARIPGFHFTATSYIKLKKDDAENLTYTQTEGDGKPGSNVSQTDTIEIKADKLQMKMTAQTRIVDGQIYILPPGASAWDTPRGGPYSPEDPAVLLMSGKLQLRDTVLTTEATENATLYRLTGVPIGNPDVDSATLRISKDTFLVQQLDSVASLPAANLKVANLVSLDTKRVVTVSQYRFQPLEAAVRVSVPERVMYKPTPVPPTEIVSTPFGTMTFYHGKRIPLSIEYPATWAISSSRPTLPYPETVFVADSGGQFTITEPTLSELGVTSRTLQEYVEVVIRTNRAMVAEFQLISSETVALNGGKKAQIIVFSGEHGQRMAYRFVYVHENGNVLNATYAYEPSTEDLGPLARYIFTNVRVGDDK